MSTAAKRLPLSSSAIFSVLHVLWVSCLNMREAGGFVQPLSVQNALSTGAMRGSVSVRSTGRDRGVVRRTALAGCVSMSLGVNGHEGGDEPLRSSSVSTRLYLEDKDSIDPDDPGGKLRSSSVSFPIETENSGGGGGHGDGGQGLGGGGGGDGGGGDKGDNDSSNDDVNKSEQIETVAKGRKRQKVLRKVDRAITRGKVPKECAQAYANLIQWPVTSVLCRNSAWRARLLGDTTFLTKIGIEIVTGTISQVLAEYQKRGKEFINELEFVMADILTCLFANFAAVWLSCPTVVVKASKRGAAKAGGAMQQFLASCPTNAFQKVAKTTADGAVTKGFTVYQRGASLVLPMPQLFVIGFGATIAGYGLIAALEIFNKWKRERSGEVQMLSDGGHAGAKVNVVGSGLAIGAFLAVSTNLRYQFIAGALEQRVFDNLLATKPHMSSMASMAVRSANLYFGSLTIVDWLRCCGLQS